MENRVVKVKNVFPREKWFHVWGGLNPTDISTRKLDDFSDYFIGPWFAGFYVFG